MRPTAQKLTLLTAIGWAQMGYGYSRSDNPPLALKAELVGLKIAEKSNNPVVLVTIYENMAISYAYDLPKRMGYARKSIAVIDYSKPNFFYAVPLDNIACYFIATNQLDSALFYAERGYVMDVSMGSHFSKSFIARTLAQIHTMLNDNDLALSFYRVSLNSAIQKNSIRDLHQSYYGLGDFYTHLQQGDSALHYYRLAFGLAGKTGTVSAVINSAQWLYRYYKQKGKADTALFFLESVTDANAQIDATRKAVELQSISFEEAVRQQELQAEKRSILVSHRLVESLNVLVLLIVFEFLNLPTNLSKRTNPYDLQRPGRRLRNWKDRKNKNGVKRPRLICLWSRPESNWNPGLRRPLYYPLYYGTNYPIREGGGWSTNPRNGAQPFGKGTAKLLKNPEFQ